MASDEAVVIRAKNWGEFQHYRNRKPPWIKLHHQLLDDYEFTCLPVASRALAPVLWLLASEYKDGEIDSTIARLSFRLHTVRDELIPALKPLITAGFFECVRDAGGVLAACPQDATAEGEAEAERETEKPSDVFFETSKDEPGRFVDRQSDKAKTRSPKGAATDERFTPFIAAISNYWKFKNPSLPFAWDASEGKALHLLLSAVPHLTLDVFTECLRNRARSDVVHTQRPRMWLADVLSFATGPLDRFGKPQGSGNGQQATALPRRPAGLERAVNNVSAAMRAIQLERANQAGGNHLGADADRGADQGRG